MTNDEEIRRGNEAQRLMSDPMLIEAFETIERGIVGAMKQAKLGDTQTHHELIVMLQLHGRLRGFFAEAIETGKLARIQKETLADKVKKTFRRGR